MMPEIYTLIPGFGVSASGSSILINLYVSATGYLVCDNFAGFGAFKPINSMEYTCVNNFTASSL